MPDRIIRYLRGSLRIRVSGLSVERFINSCSHKGIHIWDLSPVGTHYDMNITIKDFKKLKPVIRKTRTKVMIIERTGFPFFINRYKNRKNFFPGFILCLFLIMFFTTYIWNIEITGNVSYSTEDILNFLNAINVKEGVKLKSIDCSEISHKIRQNYNDIIWVSSSVEGTNLKIHIKENNTSNNKNINNKQNIPYDIIADNNAQITRIVIRNGMNLVKTGAHVNKGDILISGKIPVYNDSKEIVDYQYCISDADIYGKSTILYEDVLKKSTYKKEFFSVQKKEYTFTFGNYRFRIGGIKNNYENFEVYSKQYNNRIFSYEARTIVPYKKISKFYSLTEMQKILSSNFQYYCKELNKKGVVILKNNVKIYTWSDRSIAKGDIIIEKSIGHKIKSQLLETGDYIDGNDGNNN